MMAVHVQRAAYRGRPPAMPNTGSRPSEGSCSSHAPEAVPSAQQLAAVGRCARRALEGGGVLSPDGERRRRRNVTRLRCARRAWRRRHRATPVCGCDRIETEILRHHLVLLELLPDALAQPVSQMPRIETSGGRPDGLSAGAPLSFGLFRSKLIGLRREERLLVGLPYRRLSRALCCAACLRRGVGARLWLGRARRTWKLTASKRQHPGLLATSRGRRQRLATREHAAQEAVGGAMRVAGRVVPLCGEGPRGCPSLPCPSSDIVWGCSCHSSWAACALAEWEEEADKTHPPGQVLRRGHFASLGNI